MKNSKDQMIQDTMDSLDNMKRAELTSLFKTRVMANFKKREDAFIFSFQKSLAMATVCICLVALNMFLFVRTKNENVTKTETAYNYFDQYLTSGSGTTLSNNLYDIKQ